MAFPVNDPRAISRSFVDLDLCGGFLSDKDGSIELSGFTIYFCWKFEFDNNVKPSNHF
jgi:hypothetical protein